MGYMHKRLESGSSKNYDNWIQALLDCTLYACVLGSVGQQQTGSNAQVTF